MEVLIIIGTIVVFVLLIVCLIYFGLKIFLRSDKNDEGGKTAMTEQEKRDKTLEEMESDICNGCKYYKGKDVCCICDVTSFAKTLVDLHYRKEEEVQKETALEYSNRIDEIVTWCISNKIGDDFDYEYFSNCIRNLKKEFGVEK